MHAADRHELDGFEEFLFGSKASSSVPISACSGLASSGLLGMVRGRAAKAQRWLARGGLKEIFLDGPRFS